MANKADQSDRSPGAARQRRWRQHQRKGIRMLPVREWPGLVDGLIDTGDITENAAMSRDSVAEAVERCAARALGIPHPDDEN